MNESSLISSYFEGIYILGRNLYFRYHYKFIFRKVQYVRVSICVRL